MVIKIESKAKRLICVAEELIYVLFKESQKQNVFL